MKKLLKVLFMESPNPQNVRQHTQLPLGLLYLATIVKQAQYDVEFKRPINLKEVETYLEYDIICLSSTTLEYPMVYNVAKIIKTKFPNTKIFIGGTHVTVLYNEVSKCTFFDSICIGEGENIILDMIKDVKNKSLKKMYKANKFIENLDEIPFIDYDLVKGKLGKSIFFEKREGNSINFITSRGCYFFCAFCASQAMWTRRVRYRSTNNIIKEMLLLKEKYNINQFRLADDNLTSNRKRCLEFCKAIKDLNVEWRCSIRAESITSEIAETMAGAGAVEISPGIESGDQRVLDYLDKHTTLEKMFKGCQNAQNAGLKIRVLMLTGTPGERKDTPELTRDYLRKLNPNYATLSTFLPLPGTPIWNNPEKFNCEILSRDFRKYNKDFCQIINGKAQKREYEPLIRNKFLTMNQQKDNVRRMELYLEEFNYNKG